MWSLRKFLKLFFEIIVPIALVIYGIIGAHKHGFHTGGWVVAGSWWYAVRVYLFFYAMQLFWFSGPYSVIPLTKMLVTGERMTVFHKVLYGFCVGGFFILVLNSIFLFWDFDNFGMALTMTLPLALITVVVVAPCKLFPPRFERTVSKKLCSILAWSFLVLFLATFAIIWARTGKPVNFWYISFPALLGVYMLMYYLAPKLEE